MIRHDRALIQGDTALDSSAGPHVDLTAAQKKTVYQSVNKTRKNNAAPIRFRLAIGALCQMASGSRQFRRRLRRAWPSRK
jgi:hypothetical protein